jgi:NAD(P)-dependent dehydrogenase (short-subunit alcohol dehydrogenase family)
LLGMPGAPAYTVSKHAAVAYAEWLSATYGHRGITVQALCPLGVRTTMLDETNLAGRVLLRPSAIEPTAVADCVATALTDSRFLILPHPEVAQMYDRRVSDAATWLSETQQFQRLLDTASRAGDPDRWLAQLRGTTDHGR